MFIYGCHLLNEDISPQAAIPMTGDDDHHPDGESWFLLTPGGMEDIPAGCQRLQVAEGVTEIPGGLLDNHRHNGKYDQLEHVRLAASVARVGNNAFHHCRNLQRLDIPNSSALEALRRGALAGCWSLREVARLPASLSLIGGGCFQDCRALTHVDLSGCSRLFLAPSVFAKCWALERIRLPPHLDRIPAKAFYECRALTAITFPATLTLIGEQAFFNCGLEIIQFQASPLVVATELTTHNGAFGACRVVHQIEFGGASMQQQEDDNDTNNDTEEGSPAGSRDEWPDILPRLFGETNGGERVGGLLLGPYATEAQQLSCIFSFLQPRMEELVRQSSNRK